MGRVCRMCLERGKTWTGDDPCCAFNEFGAFSSDNWNCATMNALRQRSRDLGTHFRDDNAAGSIGYVPYETDDDQGYIVMTWYKDRGNTQLAWRTSSEPVTYNLTEEVALDALDYSKQFLRLGSGE